MENKSIVAFPILQKNKARDIFFFFYSISRKWSIMESQADQLLFLGKVILRLGLGRAVSVCSAVLA